LRRLVAAAQVSLLLAVPAYAGTPPPPPAHHVPPPPDYEPGPPYHAPPYEAYDPLPIAMRVIYAPFYAVGLVLRYGVYYVLVAPLEVLGRTLAYGVEGGVERNQEEEWDKR
jgi:hypothetical protein